MVDLQSTALATWLRRLFRIPQPKMPRKIEFVRLENLFPNNKSKIIPHGRMLAFVKCSSQGIVLMWAKFSVKGNPKDSIGQGVVVTLLFCQFWSDSSPLFLICFLFEGVREIHRELLCSQGGAPLVLAAGPQIR